MLYGKSLAMLQTGVRHLEAKDIPIPGIDDDGAILKLEDAELAIKTLARELDGEESVSSGLIPPRQTTNYQQDEL